MAKYIELSELQKFCREYTEVDAIGLILAGRTDLLHTADVIEKEKIDRTKKRIREMADEAYEEHEKRVYVGLCLALTALQNELN